MTLLKLKSKIKISLLFLTCFILMSCPGGHFHEYEYVGTEIPQEDFPYTRIEFNKESGLHIKVGYYYQFIEEKENGLATFIKTNSDFDLNKNVIVKEVKSSIFGKLKTKNIPSYMPGAINTDNTLMYNLTFKERNERKALKKIENDTISIELTNGKKLIFARQTE